MTNDRTPLQELRDALKGKDGPRAREIKAIWYIERAALSDEDFERAAAFPGPVLSFPDPQSPNEDLVFEKIVYDGGTVIECEGVVVCRLA